MLSTIRKLHLNTDPHFTRMCWILLTEFSSCFCLPGQKGAASCSPSELSAAFQEHVLPCLWASPSQQSQDRVLAEGYGRSLKAGDSTPSANLCVSPHQNVRFLFLMIICILYCSEMQSLC